MHVKAEQKNGRVIGRSELKKQKKSYSCPAIIQPHTGHLIYSTLGENVREWEQDENKNEIERSRCLRLEKTNVSHAWCAFMALSAHTSKDTGWTLLPFVVNTDIIQSVVIPNCQATVGYCCAPLVYICRKEAWAHLSVTLSGPGKITSLWRRKWWASDL